jgi:hypothetical protein
MAIFCAKNRGNSISTEDVLDEFKKERAKQEKTKQMQEKEAIKKYRENNPHWRTDEDLKKTSLHLARLDRIIKIRS